MAKKSLILYIINYETAPNYVIRNAFKNHFAPFEEYDWCGIKNKIGLEQMQHQFINNLRQKRPHYCFMQIQDVASMSIPMIREMAKYTKIINWTGDLKSTKVWYDWLYNIGKEIFLTLFTNETDVKLLRGWGVNADYLQVGFDNVWYNKKQHVQGWPEIVFCANHYSHYPLSDYRTKCVLALKEEFKDRFGLYGDGWNKIGLKNIKPIGNKLEAEAYNSSKVALSISSFDYERYHSDRLFRIMACGGAMALSHRFQRMEEDFIFPDLGYTNVVPFDDVQTMIRYCKMFIQPGSGDARKEIADNAYNYVHQHCTWDVRCKELINLLEKYS